MNSTNQIKKYNQYLIANKIDLDIDEYFTIIKDKFYPIEIGVGFLKFFISVADTDKFNINQMNLFDHKLIPDFSYVNTLKLLVDNKLQKDKDYKVTTILDKQYSANYTKKEYTITLNAFSKCLLNTKDNMYRNPCILCNHILHNYNEYRVKKDIKTSFGLFITMIILLALWTYFIL